MSLKQSMYRALQTVFLVLIALFIFLGASSGKCETTMFDCIKANELGFQITYDKDQDMTFVDTLNDKSLNRFAPFLGTDESNQYGAFVYSDIQVYDEGDYEQYAFMHIWLDSIVPWTMHFSQVDFIIDDVKYIFDVEPDRNIQEIENGIREYSFIVIDVESQDFLDKLCNTDVAKSDVLVTLHGDKDYSFHMTQDMITDISQIYYAMKECNGSFLTYGNVLRMKSLDKTKTSTKELKVGDTLFLGSYEQDNNEGNGPEPIEWQVLATKENQGETGEETYALLISKYALDGGLFHLENENVTWGSSDIREWLNLDFYVPAFSPYEKCAILETEVDNSNDQNYENWGTYDTDSTYDKIFLLSYKEMNDYLSNPTVEATTYVQENFYEVYDGDTCTWWLRSPGKDAHDIAYIATSQIPMEGNASEVFCGYRPAMWINITGEWENYYSGIEARAAHAEQENDYTEAIRLYDSLHNCNDAVQKAAESKYAYAVYMMNQKQNSKAAYNLFLEYENYCSMHEIKLDLSYEKALAQCRDIETCSIIEGEAAQAEKDHDYLNAIRLYESMQGYNNSYQKAAECRYDYALSLVNGYKYDDAYHMLLEYAGYVSEKGLTLSKNYNDSLRKCEYHLACALQETGDYLRAVKMFEELGNYKDSSERLLSCYTESAITRLEVNADSQKTDLNSGFGKLYDIPTRDVHFGWSLGRFIVSGYTSVLNQTSTAPVFLKKVGDTVTLYFRLDQNIDQLDFKQNLIISEDIDGMDQKFNIRKSNFGRGALIIQHTDYQNVKHDPVIYTDYLNAVDGKGACTIVALKEEGDYEIALNYEIKYTPRKLFSLEIVPEYTNYSIRFSVQVRNGNCMVFPMEIGSNNELYNNSVTQEGFFLDLARSRYLDINVKRSILKNGVEDVRSNAPAREGDQYNQEGLYTITVSNRYTGESTIKKIFVGSDEQSKEYISNGLLEKPSGK